MKVSPLLKTDQTSCFDETGTEINCKDTGQDGAFNIGCRVTHGRFNVIGDRVADRQTGLRWHKNANLPKFPLTWKEALDFINDINDSERLGLDRWRLPSRSELFSLISHQHINPALPKGHPFDDVFNGYYWTQTECVRLPDQAWYVHLGGGRIYRGMKHGSYLVWPVSGITVENYSQTNRFSIIENLLHDHMTGKMWLAEDGSGDHPVTWNEAFNNITAINNSGMTPHTDWRLPNIRELESLIDTGKHSPAVAYGDSVTTVQDGYWSATTSVYEPRYAWVLYTGDGAVGVGYKPRAEFFTIAVR